MCMSVYVDVWSSNAKQSLKALGLYYLEMSITKFDDVLSVEGYIGQCIKHLVLQWSMYLSFSIDCNDVFKKNIGSEVAMASFSKNSSQSLIFAFLQFGKHVAESKTSQSLILTNLWFSTYFCLNLFLKIHQKWKFY